MENNLSTGAELDGTESNCKANVFKGESVLWDQKSIGFICRQGLSRYPWSSILILDKLFPWEVYVEVDELEWFSRLFLLDGFACSSEELASDWQEILIEEVNSFSLWLL